MNALSIVDVVAALVFVALIAAAAAAIVVYNGFVRLANACDRAWSNIDVLLKQRYDEIPNLVAVCRGYMEYERDVLTRVVEARQSGLEALARAASNHAEDTPRAERAGRGARERGRELSEADAAGALVLAAVADLFALAEEYPDLRANEQFLKLQTRITGLESEIADRREHFNHCVTNYNVRREQIPDVIVARLLGLSRRTLLRVPAAERRLPRVFREASTAV